MPKSTLSSLHQSCLYQVLLIFFLINTARAQQFYNQTPEFLNANSVWVFGDSAGVDFNLSTPLPFKSGVSSFEGIASVSDPISGSLLFYSDGNRCWNRNGQVMPNGDSLHGNGNGQTQFPITSTTQGACIVPVIDSPGKYYLFSLHGPTDGLSRYNGGGSLFYSVVDMNLIGGLGDIVSGRKNIVLSTDTLSESMIAIPGDNCDIWLMVHSYRDPVFKAYHITRDGIDPNPVISLTGGQVNKTFNYSGEPFSSYFVGGMAVSPDRQTLAITSMSAPCLIGPVDSLAGVLLCKFDPATGIVTDAIEVEQNLNAYTCAFSPDNSKLYLPNLDALTGSLAVQQYDISTFTEVAINASKQTIGNIALNNPSLEGVGYLKLYREKVYLLRLNDSSISTIHHPNLSGIAADFQYGDLPLSPSTQGIASLPNEVVYHSSPDTVSERVMDTLICEIDSLKLEPKQASANHLYVWSNGSFDSILTIQGEGTYWVLYGDGCHYRVDTFVVEHAELIPPVININEFELGTATTYSTYQWLLFGIPIPGATSRYFTVTENGDYQVIVSNGTCWDTSEIYTVNNASIEDIRKPADKVTIYPNPTPDIVFIKSPYDVNAKLYDVTGRLLREVKFKDQISLQNYEEGIYFLHIIDRHGVLIKIQKVIKTRIR